MGKIIEEYIEAKLHQAYVTRTIEKLWDIAQKYEKLESDYNNRLRTEMVAMLKDLRLEIEKIFDNRPLPCSHYQRTLFYGEVDDLILDKINALKG